MSDRCGACGGPMPPSRVGPARKWCSDRCRKRQYARPCEDCGAPHGGSASRSRQRFCAACARLRAGEASTRRASAKRALVERMWAEGALGKDILAAAGLHLSPSSASAYISQLRCVHGYNLPLRRPSVSRASRAADTLGAWRERQAA